MRVRVIERWQAQSFDVYVFDEPIRENATSPDAKIHRHVEGDVWRIEEVGEADPFTGLPKPSLSLPSFVMEELIIQAQKTTPSLSRNDAVTDARKTRDALLKMIEKCVDDWTRQR